MPDTQSSSGAQAPHPLSDPAFQRASHVARRADGGRWMPGLDDQPLHSEIFASTRDGSGAGLALGLARDALRIERQNADAGVSAVRDTHDLRQVLWVQDSRAVQRGGRPYIHGLPPELRERVIHVEAQSAQDALFALEEGLRCRDLICVIGEISGNPRVFDFTASRRLSLTAEQHGVPLWLVRLDAAPELSSARMRWRAGPASSPRPLWNQDAPGRAAWKAELFRARGHAPGEWILSNDNGRLAARKTGARLAANTQGSGDMVRPTFGRSLAAFARAGRSRSGGASM